jgi:hypothetical protein
VRRARRRRHASARPHDSDDETLTILAAEALPADELIAQAQDFALMVGCLDHLGGCSVRSYLCGCWTMSPARTWRMLGLPPSHVAVLLYRAKQNLRSCMLSAGYRP